jgi:hypothetical protein
MPVNDDEIAAAISALTPEEQEELKAALSATGDPAVSNAAARGGNDVHGSPSLQRGAISRFLEPIGEAVTGLAQLPGALASPTSYPAMGKAIVEPSIEQAKGAVRAAGSGDIGEAALRALAVADVGGVGAGIGESLAEGNVAGALGKATVAAAPFVSKVPVRPTTIAGLLKRQAAKRIIDVMRPTTKRVGTAREIADDLVGGPPFRDSAPTAGGIGVGNLDTLTARAAARAEGAGKTIGAFESLTTPTDPSGVPARLRAEAARRETVPPPRTELEEVATGLLDEFEDPIMGITAKTVKGTPISGNKALVSAFRTEAQRIDDLAAQYPDKTVPVGELFKMRRTIGERVSRGYNKQVGDTSSSELAAGVSARERLKELLHNEVPASIIPDREYRVFRNAAINFSRHQDATLTNRGLKGLKELLAGRAAGAAMGMGVGGLSAGPLGGVAGALAGVALGESAVWGSFRAATYSRLAKALNSGRDKAAEILQQASFAAAAGKAERNRRAQRELQQQAEGVVEP